VIGDAASSCDHPQFYFRRLMHKTQVFISPDSEHMRTRLTHSLDVMQIARTMTRPVRANEDLTEEVCRPSGNKAAFAWVSARCLRVLRVRAFPDDH